MHHVGAISFMISTVSLKNGSVMGQRLNHCAFLRLVWLRGWGSCPVCDSGGSPTVNGSLIPGKFCNNLILVYTQWKLEVEIIWLKETPQWLLEHWGGNASECLTPHIPSSSLWNHSQSLFWFCSMRESWLRNNVDSITNVHPNVDVNVNLGA